MADGGSRSDGGIGVYTGRDWPTSPASIAASGEIEFGNFVLVPEARLFLRNGKPVEVGGRAFDLLFILARFRGQVVTKQTIIDHVWPSTLVEESNLRFQMVLLRKALGPDRDLIKTIPGRGYLLATGPAASVVPDAAHSSDRPWPGPMGPAPEIAPQDTDRHLVVIIDDDPNIREAMKGLLHSAGIAAEAFASVNDFTHASLAAPPRCIILDVFMPGRSGLDFQMDLSLSGSGPPLIFISGHADVHMCVRAMKAGAFEFLTKPVRHQELLEAVERAISLAEH